MRDFLAKAVPVMIPFFALALGAGLDLHKVWQAGLLGIGRGADLIMYLWVCISLNLLLSLHLKLRRQQETITKLVRHVALANAFVRTDDTKDRQGCGAADSATTPGRRAYVHANARSDRLTSSIRTAG